jgi:hypothetical protein
VATHIAYGLEITVVDARQDTSRPWYKPPRYTGPAAAATRLGEIEMTSIRQAVRDILARIGAGTRGASRIGRLNFLDHGSCQGFEMGDDYVSMQTLPSHAMEFAKLTPHFGPGAIVHLQHCNIGQYPLLVAALAQVFAVPVYAGTGLHNPVLRMNYGAPGEWPEDYIRGNPDGTVTQNAGRPSIIDPGDAIVPVPFLGPIRIDL